MVKLRNRNKWRKILLVKRKVFHYVRKKSLVVMQIMPNSYIGNQYLDMNLERNQNKIIKLTKDM